MHLETAFDTLGVDTGISTRQLDDRYADIQNTFARCDETDPTVQYVLRYILRAYRTVHQYVRHRQQSPRPATRGVRKEATYVSVYENVNGTSKQSIRESYYDGNTRKRITNEHNYVNGEPVPHHYLHRIGE